MRIFIVEDSAIFVKAITSLVEEIEGIDIVGSTGDAGRAKEEILRLNPDVVILDVQITGGSGLDVLKSVKSEARKALVAIIFSSKAEPGYRRACLKLGADFVFDKSQDYDRLVEVLRSIAVYKGADSGEGGACAACPENAPTES